MSTMASTGTKTTQVFRVYNKATPKRYGTQ